MITSLLEFRLYYFPSHSDAAVADLLGWDGVRYRLELQLREWQRDFEAVLGASDTLHSLVAGPTATEAGAVAHSCEMEEAL